MPADEKLKNPLSNRFSGALAHAAELHRDQSRKGTQIPYVAHLLAVAGLVLEHGGNEDQAIAALLHDAVEDQGFENSEVILAGYGYAVHEIVMACTDVDVPDGAEKPKSDWHQRKESYIARVANEAAALKLVSAADKLHNARSVLSDYRNLGDDLWARFNGKKKGTLWYYRALVTAFRQGEQSEGLTRLVGELDRVVSELEMRAGVGS